MVNCASVFNHIKVNYPLTPFGGELQTRVLKFNKPPTQSQELSVTGTTSYCLYQRVLVSSAEGHIFFNDDHRTVVSHYLPYTRRPHCRTCHGPASCGTSQSVAWAWESSARQGDSGRCSRPLRWEDTPRYGRSGTYRYH